MVDEFTEVSHEGWGSRLGNSIKGVLIGGLMFLAAFPLLWWNEGRAVRRYADLAEGRGLVVTVSPETVDSGNEGKLVFMSGEATTDETLADEQFGVSVENALRLERKVEMYQWEEEKRTKKTKKLGGGTRTETTYSYDEVWSDRVIDSSSFRKSEGHRNPGSMPFQGREHTADPVTVGAFTLSEGLVKDIDAWEPVSVSESDLAEATVPQKEKLSVTGQGFYYSSAGAANPGAPRIGDTRVRFRSVPSTTVSFYSKQTGDTFAPYTTTGGGTLQRLTVGVATAEELFSEAEDEAAMLTWILRLVGFLLMTIGISLVFKPLVVFADVIPFLGDLLGTGVGLFAGVVALFFSLLTISLAWLFYRPLFGVPLLILAVAAVVLGKKGLARKGAAAQVASPPGAEE